MGGDGAFNLEGGTLLNRINGFIRAPQERSLTSSPCEDTETLASELEEGSHKNITQNGTLILGFPTFRLMINKSLLLVSHPVCGILL